MRIIAGRYKRRTLLAPLGKETRPTTDQTREAIFNLVCARIDLDQIDVLDLFCGTGALGLEAMSRGAGSLIGIENNAKTLAVALQNARSLDPKMNVRFLQSDVYQWIKSQIKGEFQLILADPPYEHSDLERLINESIGLLSPQGLFVLEHDRSKSFEGNACFKVSRTYGKSAVSLFANQ
ncbi:MAG: 16S rRNA (guanine(966)-N(2))-methyltransferase RsmD [Bacteroidetes bacterium]|nr:16S rRNA (guanine(966)-N(2))-methyltransferase RsmD [Bacteroidota bacterium]